MKWKNYIESISKDYHFKAPATNIEIAHLENFVKGWITGEITV